MSLPVTPSDKSDLQQALSEVIQLIIPTTNLLSENISGGYGDDIVNALVEKVHTTFMEQIPLFSIHHALQVLGVFHDIFEDIPNLDIMVELFSGGKQINSHVSQLMEYAFDQGDL